jgi:outer membrane lipoprotein-sorting protein
MTIFEKTPALRWAVPAVTAVALVGGGSAITGLHAIADAGLPARTAAQLLVDVQQARLEGLSGTVVQKSDLGLPSLPGLGAGGSGGMASSNLTSMISGTHTMRVWFAGPDKARMALLGTLGESDVIHNGNDVWVWASQDKTAKHYVLPAHVAGKGITPGMPGPAGVPTSPQAAADKALAAISPSTEVTTSGTATVAGRSAYELVLTPKEATSLVDQVRIAIDGERHVPVRVQVFAKSVADPVFEVGFSSVDFARPDGAQFAFKPPPGTTVTEGKTPAVGKAAASSKTNTLAPQSKSADMPTVIGKGWGSALVVKMPAPTASAGTTSGTGAATDKTVAGLMKYVGMLPKVSGKWGSGHLMAGTAFSALLTDDGRLVVGAVTPKGLYAALAAK